MTSDGAGERVGLQVAAERLGVHYQTAYRWVRQGALPAVKVRGAYQVDVADLERFHHDRHRPEPPPAGRAVRDWGRFAGQVHDALSSGDETGVRDQVDQLVAGGVRLVDCCDRMIAPAMRRIGEEWMAGQITIAVERRASAICGRLLGRLTPSPPGRPRGTAVVCTPRTDEHDLPGQMATAVLREDHWRVHHLGTGVPDVDIVGLIRQVEPGLVVVSTAWPPAAEEAAALASTVRMLGPRVLVGRPGMTLGDLVAMAQQS